MDNRIVFFLDILGFSKCVEKSNRKNNFKKIFEIINSFNLLNQILNNIKKDISPTILNSLVITQFSDSVVISIKYNEGDSLFFVLHIISTLLIKILYKYNILMRGAADIGKLFHTEKNIFGIPYQNAYLMEEKNAIFPRIIIPDKIVNSCYSSIQDSMNEKENIQSLLKKDFDGMFYIDYLNPDQVTFALENAKIYGKKTIKFYEKITKKIEQELKKTRDISIKQKYQWLQNKTVQAIQNLNNIIDKKNTNYLE